MKSSKIIPREEQRRFWRVVKACIDEFFPNQKDELTAKATAFRKQIESRSIGEIEYFYHAEPIRVVYTLADEPIDLENVLDRYNRIREQEDWFFS